MRHLFSALFVTLLVAGATAGTAAAQPAGGGAYGAAGCGLGSLVFGAKPGFMQVFAATTNGSFGSQTFGITFGTSNCGSTSGGIAAKSFIETNREAFAKDVSRGSGETIDNLAALSGCTDGKAVGRSLQKNFKQIFPSAKATNTEVSSAALEALKADKQLACSQLI
ncbi:MAG TPA: DUF3015 family protein [Kofleriaceae bacterium]